MTWVEYLFSTGTVLLVFAIYMLMPRLRKRSLYFGVTVEAGFRESDDGRRIAGRYYAGLRVAALVVLAAQAGAFALQSHAGVFAMTLVTLGACVGFWLRAWASTRPHAAAASPIREAPLTSEADERLPGGWSAAVPFLLVLGALGWVFQNYDSLPQRYPRHWGPAGQPDAWADKTPLVVAAPGLAGLAVLVLILSTALFILRRAKRGSGGEENDFGRRHRRANLLLLVVTLWALGALFAYLVLLPQLPEMDGLLLPLTVLLPLPVILFMAWRTYKLSIEPTGGSDGTPEQCWKLGSFYYNPADPALLVEKRSGPGFTLNFGHRLSWLLLAGLGAIIVLPILLR